MSATLNRPLGFQYFIRHQQGSRGLIVLKLSFTDAVKAEGELPRNGQVRWNDANCC